jgi:hypothetical protein
MRLFILCMCVCACGCQATRPRWEIQVNVTVESKLDEMNKVTGSVGLKRPITGYALRGEVKSTQGEIR